jgi:hypothetical protein
MLRWPCREGERIKKRLQGRETRNRKEKERGKEKIGKIGKRQTDFPFLDIVIHKLYCPHYYWVMKIKGGSYIN